MEKLQKKHPVFNIIYLKERPKQNSLLSSFSEYKDSTRRVSTEIKERNYTKINNLIPQLSSFLQDEHSIDEENNLTQAICLEKISNKDRSEIRNTKSIESFWKRSAKNKGRYLSEIL